MVREVWAWSRCGTHGVAPPCISPDLPAPSRRSWPVCRSSGEKDHSSSINGPLKGNLGLESRIVEFITLTMRERKKVDVMKRIHEIPVRNQESGSQGSQEVVSAGNSQPRRAGMQLTCWRSITIPIGVMEAMKDCRGSRSVNLISSPSNTMRANVYNWNIQHKIMNRARRMIVVIAVRILDTENREIAPTIPGSSLAAIWDMNAEYALVAAQVRGGAEWLTVSSVPRIKGMKRVAGAIATTLKASRLVILLEVRLEKDEFSSLILITNVTPRCEKILERTLEGQ